MTNDQVLREVLSLLLISLKTVKLQLKKISYMYKRALITTRSTIGKIKAIETTHAMLIVEFLHSDGIGEQKASN